MPPITPFSCSRTSVIARFVRSPCGPPPHLHASPEHVRHPGAGLADFQRAFGDESPTLPPLVAVSLAGDADNTGGHTLAYIAGLSFAQ